MNSIILRIAARQLLPILMVLSLFILFRGHNAPGGGFIGGLIASSAFILYAIAFGHRSAEEKIKIEPGVFMALGLLLALGSGIPSFLKNEAFVTHEFFKFHIPVLGKMIISTPLIFDIGVFFVVFGVLLTIVFTLMEE
ncbi:MAG: Na+/H+ antiporter subunit B [candidate division KSB1 bacterium]|jgi:multicomponent Na+:H+ antiporter subunit B|nr:Na+/H+ antiporter subunit B [candidate division KSB1 bacterium]